MPDHTHGDGFTPDGGTLGAPESPALESPAPESPAPETGDLVVDAALRDLSAVDPTDLDATLAAGEAVHGRLTSRLSDLGT